MRPPAWPRLARHLDRACKRPAPPRSIAAGRPLGRRARSWRRRRWPGSGASPAGRPPASSSSRSCDTASSIVPTIHPGPGRPISPLGSRAAVALHHPLRPPGQVVLVGAITHRSSPRRRRWTGPSPPPSTPRRPFRAASGRRRATETRCCTRRPAWPPGRCCDGRRCRRRSRSVGDLHGLGPGVAGFEPVWRPSKSNGPGSHDLLMISSCSSSISSQMGREGEPVGDVLELVPPGTDAELDLAAGQVVGGDDHLGHQRRVPEGRRRRA